MQSLRITGQHVEIGIDKVGWLMECVKCFVNRFSIVFLEVNEVSGAQPTRNIRSKASARKDEAINKPGTSVCCFVSNSFLFFNFTVCF